MSEFTDFQVGMGLGAICAIIGIFIGMFFLWFSDLIDTIKKGE
jgi:hypothetical protein